MTAIHFTFNHLQEAMKAKLTMAGKPHQVLSNHLSALRGFMADRGFTPERTIGSHLRASYYRRLHEHVETLSQQGRSSAFIANRKNLLGHWRSLLLEQDRESAVTANSYSPFQVALRELLSAAGNVNRLARDSGVSKSALKRWAAGVTPQTASLNKVRRLESYFGLERGALISLLGDTPATSLETTATATPIQYRERLRQNSSSTFRLQVVSEDFKAEWRDFFIYKTSMLPILERQPNGQWRLTEHTTIVPSEERWYGFLANKYCPTASLNWSNLARYCGWLSMSKSCGGLGLPCEAVQSLACVLSVPNLSNYVQWLALRADGKIHGGIINLITFVKSLVHPNSGYLTQSPQLAEALHPALGLTGGWQELCSKTFEWTQKAFQQLSPKKQRSRDPFEPIRQVLELGNPMEAVSDMVQRMKAARPSTGGVTEAIWARDVLLIKLLASNPLRAKNVKLLSYRPDNSGQLRQARDGSWRIVITPEWFKNQAGAAKDQPYDMPVDEALWGDIERYIKHFRPHLAGAKESDFVFLSADGSADTNGWESLNKRVFQLTKRYLLHCPGAGPHAFRYINGTAILKALPGAWEVAAQVLHDKEETVRKHYAHLRGTDGAARAHAALKSAFGRM
ncbi:MAG: hypothetical protein JNJ95_01755 [Dechloromonas sp.]|nr:hypothetical protein [Dechloromonas sp.]